jgi:hypothetical protein
MNYGVKKEVTPRASILFRHVGAQQADFAALTPRVTRDTSRILPGTVIRDDFMVDETTYYIAKCFVLFAK